MGTFYKTARWKKKRGGILQRDGYMCTECYKYGRRIDATTVHHIKSIEQFPELALTDSNLVSLCEPCHNKKHPEKGGSLLRKDFKKRPY